MRIRLPLFARRSKKRLPRATRVLFSSSRVAALTSRAISRLIKLSARRERLRDRADENGPPALAQRTLHATPVRETSAKAKPVRATKLIFLDSMWRLYSANKVWIAARKSPGF
jgi:hypothetical protein